MVDQRLNIYVFFPLFVLALLFFHFRFDLCALTPSKCHESVETIFRLFHQLQRGHQNFHLMDSKPYVTMYFPSEMSIYDWH